MDWKAKGVGWYEDLRYGLLRWPVFSSLHCCAPTRITGDLFEPSCCGPDEVSETWLILPDWAPLKAKYHFTEKSHNTVVVSEAFIARMTQLQLKSNTPHLSSCYRPSGCWYSKQPPLTPAFSAHPGCFYQNNLSNIIAMASQVWTSDHCQLLLLHRSFHLDIYYVRAWIQNMSLTVHVVAKLLLLCCYLSLHGDFNTLVSSVLSLVVHLCLWLDVEAFLLFHPHGCIQTSTLQQLLVSEQNRIIRKTKTWGNGLTGNWRPKCPKTTRKKDGIRLWGSETLIQTLTCCKTKTHRKGPPVFSGVSYADLRPVCGTFSHCEIHSFVHFLRLFYTDVH